MANAAPVALPIGHSWYSPDRKVSASIGADGRLLVLVNGGPLYLYPFPVEQTEASGGDHSDR